MYVDVIMKMLYIHIAYQIQMNYFMSK